MKNINDYNSLIIGQCMCNIGLFIHRKIALDI